MTGFSRGIAAACLATLVFTGCAGSRFKAASRPAVVAVGAKEKLYVALPVIADTAADSALAGIGWGEGRLTRELRKEMIFQFKRQGVSMVEDSAQADVILSVVLSEYALGGGAASHFNVAGLLKSRAGERRIAFRTDAEKGQAPQREDPTVDNIRLMATSMVEGSAKDPNAKQAGPDGPGFYNPGLILNL